MSEEVEHEVTESDPIETQQEPEQEPEQTQDEPVKAEPDKRFARKYDELTRFEAQLRSRESDLKQRWKEVESFKSQQEEFTALLQLAKEDPVAFFEKLEPHGLNYDKLATDIASGKKLDPVQREIRQLQERIAQLESYKQSSVEQVQQAKADQIIADEKSRLVKFIRDNSEEYALLASDKDENIAEELFKHKANFWNQTGKEIDDKTLADMLENNLQTAIEKLYPTYTKKRQPKPEPEPKTITTSYTANPNTSPSKPLSREERMKLAMRHLVK